VLPKRLQACARDARIILSGRDHIMERFTLPAGFRPGLVAFAALLLLAAPSSATAQERWSSSGPSGHSPIGVMGDHTHSQGEWMAALMYSRLSMSGLKDGAARVSVDEAWMDYQMVPLEMTMDMYMPHLMWAPSDQVTLMAMGMWMDHQMDVRMANHLMAGHGQGGGMGNGHGMEFHEHGGVPTARVRLGASMDGCSIEEVEGSELEAVPEDVGITGQSSARATWCMGVPKVYQSTRSGRRSPELEIERLAAVQVGSPWSGSLSVG
jgi:hypothetical protein